MRFILIIAAFIITIASLSAQEERFRILKDGALLVRLKTSQNLIAAYRKKGENQKALDAEAAQAKENKEIAEAFRNNYKFGKVYFFYSNYSEEIRNGNFKHLMDAGLQPYNGFSGSFLTGEFGYSETSSIDSFILMDRNFVQLKKPFPMVRVNKMFSTRTIDEIVVILEEQLEGRNSK